MVSKIVDALAGKTTTTGTGTYAITANVTGFREFAQMNDGEQVVAVIRNDVDLEIGLYTKNGGASPTLARTTIYMNKSGTTGAVNWAGGEKDIRSTIEASIVPLLIQNNIWLQDQYFRGAKVCLDANDDSYIYSDADGAIVVVLNAVEFARFVSGAPSALRLSYSELGSGSGPKLALDRNSSSPAVNDTLGELIFTGRNAAGASQIYAKLQAYLVDPTTSTEDGGLNIIVARDGDDEVALAVNPNYAFIFPFVQEPTTAMLVGKTSQGGNIVGVEVRTDGLIACTTNDNAILLLNRKNGDGDIIYIQRDGTTKAVVSMSGDTVTWGNFAGAHRTSTEEPLDTLQIGNVMEATDEPNDADHQPYIPRVRLAQPNSKSVFGVYSGIDDTGQVSIIAIGAYQILVSGPVTNGDYLKTSDTPGVAVSQGEDDVMHSYTIAKATRTDLRTETRLVPATIHCG